jgi:hypothetical protein
MIDPLLHFTPVLFDNRGKKLQFPIAPPACPNALPKKRRMALIHERSEYS